MKTCFADTWFYIALLDRDDEHHVRVNRFIAGNDVMFVTTRWILSEAGNALGSTRLRPQITELLNNLERDPITLIEKSSDQIYLKGLKLFTARSDKQWSLNDCISFVVMEEQNLAEALTGDRHFEQAGFKALFA